MRYRLIGLDLDGTLLAKHGKPGEANIDAIRAAQAAGARVVPCTGRSWLGAREPLADFPNPDLGVFTSGASIARVTTGERLDLAVIEPHLVAQLIEQLADLSHPILVLKERNVVEYDYLIIGAGPLNPNITAWIEMIGATFRTCTRPTLEDLHHGLRVELVVPTEACANVCRAIRDRMGDFLNVHHFLAIEEPAGPAGGCQLVEIFAAGVDKWRGLSWLAREWNIPTDQIAMIGDEVNDVAALKAAGCGIAMGNAVPAAKAVADRITLRCDENGVAHALEKLIAGVW